MSDDLEEMLKAALSRQPVPTGFSSRVTARLTSQTPPQVKRAVWPKVWMAIAATLVVLVSVTFVLRERREARQRHTQNLVYALRLADAKLNVVEARLRRVAIAVPSTSTDPATKESSRNR
jgi:hypothetical protein